MGNKIIYKGNSVGETIQATVMPTASVDHLGEIVQYVGPDTTTSPIYKKGKFYECKPYGTSAYRWLSVELVRGVNHAMYSEAWGGTDSKSDLIDTLNAFNEDLIEAAQDCDINQNVALYSCYVDTPYEGMPTNTQIKAYYDSDAGWVYRGYSSSTADEFAIIPTGSPITDVSVVKLGSGDGTPHWSGTRAEYEAIKDTLEPGTYVSITDDYDDGLEVVDVVENGNTNPVTSNAVYDILNASITDLTADETVMTYDDYTVETLGAHMYQVGKLCWVHIDYRATYTGDVALDTDGHKDFWSNKYSIPDFDDVSEWSAIPCFGYVSNSHRRFEITLNNFGVTGGQKAISFRLRYGEDEPIYTGDVFNLRCICCFAKA